MTAYTFGGPPRYSHQMDALRRMIETRGITALLMEPGCLTGDSTVSINRGGKGWDLSLRDLHDRFNGIGRVRWRGDLPTMIRRAEPDGTLRLGEVVAVLDSGEKPVYRLTLDSGQTLTGTADHPVLTERGYVGLIDLVPGNRVVVASSDRSQSRERRGGSVSGWTHANVTSVVYSGLQQTYDVSVADEPHNFMANGIATHNTGKTMPTIDYAGLLAMKSPTGVARVLVVAPLAAVDTWVNQAETALSDQVNLWAEAIGGRVTQRAEALAARGMRSYPRWTSARSQGTRHPSALHQRKAIALAHRGTDDPSFGPDAMPDDKPLLVLTVVNKDTFSQRGQVASKTSADIVLEGVKAFSPDLVVVDESHTIKSPSSNVSRLMSRVGKHAPRRIILTGTVIPRSPMDVFAQWRFLEPTAFGDVQPDGSRRNATLGRFRDRFARMGGYMGREVVGFCNTPDAPIWMRDGTFKALNEVQVGDSLMGWAPTETTVKGGSRRIYVDSRVTGISRRWAENVVEVELSSGRKIKCTTDHKWLRVNPKDAEDVWVTVMDHPYHKNRGFKIDIARLVEVPRELSPQERESAAWLAGFYDGEGHGAAFSQSIEHNPDTCIRLEQELQTLGLTYGVTEHRPTKAATFYLTGGQQTYVNVLNWLPITRREALIDLLHWSRASRYKKGLEEPKRLHKTRETVVKVTPLPPQEVISMQTTTGNYVAWGLASKNCNLDEMQDIMAKNSVVVRKEDALDLPPTTDVTVPVHLSPGESKAYREMKDALAADLEDGSTATVTSRLTQMLRLRQITSGHLPSDDGTLKVVGDAKARTIRSIVHDTLADESRVVVFAVFTAEIEVLRQRLAESGTTVEVINGSTPTSERMAIRERFGSDSPERIVLVAQIKTMSLAINELVTASHAIFASLSQQRDDLVQARDRLNRIGQTGHKVTFWYAVAPGTVDQVILDSHQDRTDLETAMLNHVAGSIESTSTATPTPSTAVENPVENPA